MKKIISAELLKTIALKNISLLGKTGSKQQYPWFP
jgi:hypothetical protein